MALTYAISELGLLEILDSRGRPTFTTRVQLTNGAEAIAGVPSGASTGSHEARERREGDPQRFGGAGVAGVWQSLREEITTKLVGAPWKSQQELDELLCSIDGTPDKSRVGANVIVGISMACARAIAIAIGTSLYDSLSGDNDLRLPVPHFNVINGGAHAQTALSFQEFMIAPIGAPNMRDAVRAGAEIYQALRSLLHDSGHPTGLGDEGGFAPSLTKPEEALGLLVAAITTAGYEASIDGVALAMDPAASGFHSDIGKYVVGSASYTSTELIDLYETLIDRFPVWSIEDGLAEDDEAGWIELTRRLGDRIQLVGDDNFVTDPKIIEDAARKGIANAALIKPNQIGTVSETLSAIDVARRNHFGQMVSHRSGETSDAFIADLAVAIGCGQVKFGAPARGERVAKYNRLLEIAASEPRVPYGLADDRRRFLRDHR
jgi:enolase